MNFEEVGRFVQEAKTNLECSHHSFSPAFARIYGLTEAVVLETFIFWCTKKARARKDCWKDRAWFRTSVVELQRRLPYLTFKQIKTAMGNLKSALVKRRFDNSNSYALSDEVIQMLPRDKSEHHLRLAGIPLNSGEELEAEDLGTQATTSPTQSSFDEDCEKRSKGIVKIWWAQKDQLVGPRGPTVRPGRPTRSKQSANKAQSSAESLPLQSSNSISRQSRSRSQTGGGVDGSRRSVRLLSDQSLQRGSSSVSEPLHRQDAKVSQEKAASF